MITWSQIFSVVGLFLMLFIGGVIGYQIRGDEISILEGRVQDLAAIIERVGYRSIWGRSGKIVPPNVFFNFSTGTLQIVSNLTAFVLPADAVEPLHLIQDLRHELRSDTSLLVKQKADGTIHVVLSYGERRERRGYYGIEYCPPDTLLLELTDEYVDINLLGESCWPPEFEVSASCLRRYLKEYAPEIGGWCRYRGAHLENGTLVATIECQGPPWGG